MKDNDYDGTDSDSDSHREQGRVFDAEAFGNTSTQLERREPVFSGFDEEEDSYEEPDRDTDYTSAYHEDSMDDEEFADVLLEEEDTDIPETQMQWRELPAARSSEERDQETEADSRFLWNEPEQPDTLQDIDDTDSREEDPVAAEYDYLDPELADDADDGYLPGEEDEVDWRDERAYQGAGSDDAQGWPLGLIVVAVVALLLLAAGGYGVIQQRSATQEEIRQLQAALGTAASPAEVAASRNALQEEQERNLELQAAVEALTLENRRLADTVAGLEVQLEAQQTASAVAAQPATPQSAATRPATPQPATPQPAAPLAAGGAWFVNFGSYGQREAAEAWVSKLKPAAGRVVVTTGSKEGKTLYRVRVVELSSQEAADKIARQLESEYGLSKLWVGSQ